MRHARPFVAMTMLASAWAGGSAFAIPIVIDPSQFQVELYATFGDSLPGGAADDAFQMIFLPASTGFAPGMYVTGGPGGDPRLYRVTGPDAITQFVSSGFTGSEGVVLAQGAYGSGLLVSEPRTQQIKRVLPDGSISTFATGVGTSPFGGAGMTFGNDGLLYVADFTGGTLQRVSAAGAVTTHAAAIGPNVVRKAVAADPTGRYGGAFVTANFNFSAVPTGTGTIHSVSADGLTQTPIASGLDGTELITPGPGGAFGDDYFIASIATADDVPNGFVFTLAPDGTLSPFLVGVNAVHVAFDTTGLLGGGMFVMELDDSDVEGPSRIWRVTAIPEPAIAAIALAAGAISLRSRRRRE